mmetsp:Transcript_16969/g.48494  ORF Transcript_16969/g.48494 Transcript_16969/m.48494 type:complete len:251 (-) Transcript_16969:22-774(-)
MAEFDVTQRWGNPGNGPAHVTSISLDTFSLNRSSSSMDIMPSIHGFSDGAKYGFVVCRGTAGSKLGRFDMEVAWSSCSSTFDCLEIVELGVDDAANGFFSGGFGYVTTDIGKILRVSNSAFDAGSIETFDAVAALGVGTTTFHHAFHDDKWVYMLPYLGPKIVVRVQLDGLAVAEAMDLSVAAGLAHPYSMWHGFHDGTHAYIGPNYDGTLIGVDFGLMVRFGVHSAPSGQGKCVKIPTSMALMYRAKPC